MRWAINEDKVNSGNRIDVRDFILLVRKKEERGIGKAPTIQLLRVTKRLLKERVIKRMDQEALRDVAKGIYSAMPWWRKSFLRAKYTFKKWWNRSGREK